MNNVLPGWIDSFPETEERREGVPMKRYGTSAEIAATMAFLASDGAAYITGQNIRRRRWCNALNMIQGERFAAG
ncbi:SDR family oxidoreductase [Chelativorans sp. AA-79]|uniref:SDR family oxidoreductase n=1 Tax=Chelativorans sp. AA-79 TaxID=3028735 RepID=UPI0023F66C77|nr:SDR family oxidoreductase [Chelativorans sp. AA-79]WEX11952.1 SDR family oxidoreductase [Chelativorans sp. AA-79]